MAILDKLAALAVQIRKRVQIAETATPETACGSVPVTGHAATCMCSGAPDSCGCLTATSVFPEDLQ